LYVSKILISIKLCQNWEPFHTLVRNWKYYAFSPTKPFIICIRICVKHLEAFQFSENDRLKLKNCRWLFASACKRVTFFGLRVILQNSSIKVSEIFFSIKILFYNIITVIHFYFCKLIILSCTMSIPNSCLAIFSSVKVK